MVTIKTRAPQARAKLIIAAFYESVSLFSSDADAIT